MGVEQSGTGLTRAGQVGSELMGAGQTGARQMVVISKRLQMMARMVTSGNRVADVGCDHGFLSIYLVQTGLSPRVIAMDVRGGPLEAAKEHIARWGLETYIETRQSDGLCELLPGEVETVVCAGMGGPLMERILTQSSEKAKQMKELILQPQSEIPRFRGFLRRAGYLVTDEDMVCDGGKYYFAMRAIPGRAVSGEESFVDFGEDTGRYDKFGEGLLRAGHPVLEQYLHRQEVSLEGLARELAAGYTDRTKKRLGEVRRDLEDIRWAFQFFDRKGR